MDFMSGGILEVSDRLTIGVPAVTRYAAGWIDPGDVHVYQGGGTERVVLRAGWEQGTQMLAVPSGEQGRFLALGTRVAKHHDRGIPKEGVEAYEVDQRSTACESLLDRHAHLPCGGNRRRQVPTRM